MAVIPLSRLPARNLALLLITFVASFAAAAEPVIPPLTGRVVDNAGLMSPADKKMVEDELMTLEQVTSDQLVVFTTDSLQGYAIEEFGLRLGRTWGIGQKDKNNGVLLIVAPNERKVRIEVGLGLETLLTNDTANAIIQTDILPAFRRGDFSGGIKAGVRAIQEVLYKIR